MAKKNFKGISPDNPALPYFSTQEGRDDHIIQDGHDSQDVHSVHNGQDGQDGQDGLNGYDGQDGRDSQDRLDDYNGQDGQDVQHGQQTDKTPKCHINLRVTQELKDYLTEASWRERKNITQYLTDLIESDMKAKAGEHNV